MRGSYFGVSPAISQVSDFSPHVVFFLFVGMSMETFK